MRKDKCAKNRPDEYWSILCTNGILQETVHDNVAPGGKGNLENAHYVFSSVSLNWLHVSSQLHCSRHPWDDRALTSSMRRSGVDIIYETFGRWHHPWDVRALTSSMRRSGADICVSSFEVDFIDFTQDLFERGALSWEILPAPEHHFVHVIAAAEKFLLLPAQILFRAQIIQQVLELFH